VALVHVFLGRGRSSSKEFSDLLNPANELTRGAEKQATGGATFSRAKRCFEVGEFVHGNQFLEIESQLISPHSFLSILSVIAGKHDQG
jgi:hypothetical protein